MGLLLGKQVLRRVDCSHPLQQLELWNMVLEMLRMLHTVPELLLLLGKESPQVV